MNDSLVAMVEGVKDTLGLMIDELETTVTDKVSQVQGNDSGAQAVRHWMERALRAEGLLAIQEAVFGQMGQAEEDWTIAQCSWCKRYFDTDTKEYVPEPDEPVPTHGICKECIIKQMLELDELDEEGG